MFEIRRILGVVTSRANNKKESEDEKENDDEKRIRARAKRSVDANAIVGAL